MNRPLIALVVSVFSCLPLVAAGDAPVSQAPMPGPEVQKLAYYLGSWIGEGETKGGPFGPAGKLSSKQSCRWFTGGFQILCEGEETGPTGTRSFLNVLGYDPDKKAYTQYSISSLGESEDDRGGSLVGNKLVYVLNQDSGTDHVQIRYTEVHLSPSLYTYEVEAAVNRKPWTVIATGKITKVK